MSQLGCGKVKTMTLALFSRSPRQDRRCWEHRPPTLAKKRKDGHPQWKWCTQKLQRVGHPPLTA